MSSRLAALIPTMLLVACAVPGPAPSPTPSPTAPPTPSPSPAAAAFYLRAWQTQALPPEHTITWLPTLTISEDLAIDGNVAIPMIYPGPLMIVPNSRAISAEGQAAIVELARELGLLEGERDFSGDGAMPGAVSAHVLLIADGQEVELVGDPNAAGPCAPGDLECQPESGSAAAFAFFWARLSYLDDWLAEELGPTAPYTPGRVLVVTTPPQPLEVPAQPVGWPLDAALAEFGEPWVVEGTRCAVVEGADLEALLPALVEANQATVFVDADDEARALLVRVVVPGEPAPCDS